MDALGISCLAAVGILALVLAARVLPGWMRHRSRIRRLRDRFAEAPLHRLSGANRPDPEPGRQS